MQTRKVYKIGIPNRSSNSWHFAMSGIDSKKLVFEFTDKLYSDLNLFNLYTSHGQHMMTIIEQYRENDGWNLIQSFDGFR